LIDENRLCTLRYDGFWGCMDTFKEKQMLEDLVAGGNAPWELWNRPPAVANRRNGNGAANGGNGAERIAPVRLEPLPAPVSGAHLGRRTP